MLHSLYLLTSLILVISTRHIVIILYSKVKIFKLLYLTLPLFHPGRTPCRAQDTSHSVLITPKSQRVPNRSSPTIFLFLSTEFDKTAWPPTGVRHALSLRIPSSSTVMTTCRHLVRRSVSRALLSRITRVSRPAPSFGSMLISAI